MVLATVESGRPVSRSVLCKGVDENGITFFTNYDSAKGDELAATPYASATFPWYLLNRQFHIRGPVTKVDPQASQDTGQPAARLAAGRVGVASVPADRLACGAGRSARRGDGPLRRHRADPRSAELGRVPHRARHRRVLAGPGRPAAQPDSCGRRSSRTPAALGRRRAISSSTLRTPRRGRPRRIAHRLTKSPSTVRISIIRHSASIPLGKSHVQRG